MFALFLFFFCQVSSGFLSFFLSFCSEPIEWIEGGRKRGDTWANINSSARGFPKILVFITLTRCNRWFFHFLTRTRAREWIPPRIKHPLFCPFDAIELILLANFVAVLWSLVASVWMLSILGSIFPRSLARLGLVSGKGMDCGALSTGHASLSLWPVSGMWFVWRYWTNLN